MTQALHIFRKDFDYLRVEVAIFLLLSALFAWMQLHIPNDEYSEPLLAFAAAWLAGRAVHADAIPGDRQFWLTRPYNRGSLLGAKLIFVAACISLPMAIAQLTVVLYAGFSLKEAVVPLLLSSLRVFLFGGLPVVALAALTPGMVSFILVALTLAVIWMSGTPSHFDTIPGPVEWLRSMLFVIPLTVITIMVLIRQYRWRATDFSRIIAIAGINAAALLFLVVPASFALKTQSWLSKKPDLAKGISITRGRTARPPSYASPDRQTFSVPLALAVEHLPPDTEVQVDDMTLSVRLPGEPITFLRRPGMNRQLQENGRAVFETLLIVDQAQYDDSIAQPVTIKGTVWLTLFGDDEKSLVSLDNPGPATQDGLRCVTTRLSDRARFVPAPPGEEPEWHPADSIACASLFQWPRKLVYAQAGDYESDFSNTRISYAPFPWGLSLTPIEVRWSEPVESDKATILTRRPLAHFRRDFELTGVKLVEFEWPPPPLPPHR